MVLIGFESVNEEALQHMHKVRNLKIGVRNYKEVIKKIHNHGIGVGGAFVFGNDEDTKDVFQRTVEFGLDSKIDVMQCTILTPVPGTRLYDRLREEGRLLLTNYPADWKHYNFLQPVFRLKHMTHDEVMEGITQLYKQTISTAISLKRAVDSAIQTKNLYEGAIAFLANRTFYSIWMRWTQKYENMKDSLALGVRDSGPPSP